MQRHKIPSRAGVVISLSESERGSARRLARPGDSDGRLASRRLHRRAVEREAEADRDPVQRGPYGIAIPKGNGMAKPMLDALKVLMATGAYKPILSKWYVLSGSDHESADQRSEALARNVVPQAN
jgi:hypothetical protein